MALHTAKLAVALLALSADALPPYPVKRQLNTTLTANERVILGVFNNDSISDDSFYYTQGLHLAGTNLSQAQWTADQWSEAGFETRLDIYNVFLNYPLDNSLNATWTNGSIYEPELQEDVLGEDPVTGFPNRVPTFHAYSASGTAEAEYVYVGLGQIADFERLLELGVELEGKIALSRYGGPFRGLKVQNAQNYGMIGCVLFNDLADDGEVKVANGYEAYPDGPARNPTYVQRGSVLFLSTAVGDPTTPGYPSKPGVPRADRFAVSPRIPSLPISFANAGPLLMALEGAGVSGEEVNRTNWVGDHETGYYSGPAEGVTLGISNLMNETYTDVWNVIGVINGTESDETIILGNHRDAWMIGGAGDPNGGSACVNEIARALGALLETGWQPRRNIVLASWDAEEYGLVGSAEWVEEFIPWLSDTAVTYINLDSATTGPIPSFVATPELHQLGIETMKKVMWPNTNGTMYDAWYAASGGQPGVLGSGSDYTPFLHSGISSVDLSSSGGPTDPIFMYHSNYDTYEWMSRFGDPGFHHHVAMAQYTALLTYHLADDYVLPLNVSNFATQMDIYYDELLETIEEYEEELDTSLLREAIDGFREHALEAEAFTVMAIALGDEYLVGVQNEKYKDFHRGFVASPGLPNRTYFRHVVFAPGRDTGYAPVTFPGITEAIIFDRNYTAAAEWVNVTANAITIAGNMLQT